jgi:hypothetical protein
LGQGEGRWRRGGREGPAGRRARVRVGGQTRGHGVLEREPDGESKMQWMKISGPNCGKSKEPSPATSEPSAPWDPAFSFGGRRAGSARDARGSNSRLRTGSALARSSPQVVRVSFAKGSGTPHLRWYVSLREGVSEPEKRGRASKQGQPLRTLILYLRWKKMLGGECSVIRGNRNTE